MSANNNTDLLSVRETALICGVHENTIRNWADQGVLTAIPMPVSGYRRFDPDEVSRFVEQRAIMERVNGTAREFL